LSSRLITSPFTISSTSSNTGVGSSSSSSSSSTSMAWNWILGKWIPVSNVGAQTVGRSQTVGHLTSRCVHTDKKTRTVGQLDDRDHSGYGDDPAHDYYEGI
jgi:hypothetical protein